MSANSKIEWTEQTWNPVTGCTEVSPGCDHCYAKTLAERWRGVPGHAFENGFDLTLHPERLQAPLGWKKPRRVFVNSMSDLFHRDIPDEFIAQVFATMTFAAQHTFQVLTKRPDRMRRLLPKLADGRVLGKALSLDVVIRGDRAQTEAVAGHAVARSWPAKNVWLGVSIESNAYAWRADMLRETPAAVRWISAEPLLGPLDAVDLTGIDWLVCGGESGHGARPMDPAWARDLRDRCVAASIPFFLKQLGGARDKRGGEDAVLDGRRWLEYPRLAGTH
jgi:protein gp37